MSSNKHPQNGFTLVIEAFVVKIILVWISFMLSSSRAEETLKHGMYKQAKGDCFVTNTLTNQRVGSVNECSQWCLRVDECVGFKYFSIKSRNMNCETLKRVESCSPNGSVANAYSSWKLYMLYPEKQAICLKNVCKNGGSCVVAPGDEDGVQCTCPEKFTGKFCEKVSGVFKSCKELHNLGSDLPNGVYNITTLGTDEGMTQTYCQMTPLEGCGGGGWTMVMKVDGSKNTFAYSSPYWLNREMYNVVGGTSAFDYIETKLPSYWSTSFSEICIGMNVRSDPKFLKITYAGSSLLSLLKDDAFRPIHDVGREDWKSLIPSYSSLQYRCNRVGFNNHASNLWMYPAARIGIIADEDGSCTSPDSFIGIGGIDKLVNVCFLGYLTFPVSGNLAACTPDNGRVNVKSMGYILVR